MAIKRVKNKKNACMRLCMCVHSCVRMRVYTCVLYIILNKACVLVCVCCLDNHFGYNVHACVRTRTCMCVHTYVLDTILNKMYFPPCF